jgi:hypothetical protein
LNTVFDSVDANDLVYYVDRMAFTGFDPKNIIRVLTRKAIQLGHDAQTFGNNIVILVMLTTIRGTSWKKAVSRMKDDTMKKQIEDICTEYGILSENDRQAGPGGRRAPLQKDDVTLSRVCQCFPLSVFRVRSKVTAQDPVSWPTADNSKLPISMRFPGALSLIPKEQKWFPVAQWWVVWACRFAVVINQPVTADSVKFWMPSLNSSTTPDAQRALAMSEAYSGDTAPPAPDASVLVGLPQAAQTWLSTAAAQFP